MRTFLIFLSAAGILGALGFAIVFALGQANALLLRLLACLVVLDHGSILLLHLLAGARVPSLVKLLRVTAPLVLIVGLSAVAESVRGGTALMSPYETWLGAVLIALGGLSAVYLARKSNESSTPPEGYSG